MTDGMPVSPETLLVVPALNAWQRLGDLGVSAGMQDELITIWDKVHDNDMSRLKFAAGLVLLAESLEGVQHPSAVVIPLQERHEVHVVESTPEPEPEPEIHTQAVEEVVVSVVHEEQQIPKAQRAKPPRAKKTPKKEVGESRKSQNEIIDSFMKNIMGEEYQLFPAGVTLEDAQALGEQLVEVYYAKRSIGRPTNVSKEQRFDEIKLHLTGKTDSQICRLLGIPLNRISKIGSFRDSLPKALRARDCTPEQCASMLEQIVAKRLALKDEPKSEMKDESTIAKGSLKEVLDDSTLIESTVMYCREFWKDVDSISLEKLLTEKSVSDDSTAARLHLRALLGSFAPLREDDTVMDRIQWDAINLICGFRTQQNEKILPVRFVGPKLSLRHHTEVNGLEAVTNGIATLVKAATKDYNRGWYPNNRTASSPNPVISGGTVMQKPEATGKKSELFENVERLCRGSGMSKSTVEMLVAHLSDELQVPIDQKQLFAGILAVRTKWNKALQHNRRNSGLEASSDIRSKDVMLPQDITIMSYLLGNETSGVMPRPYRVLIKDRALLGRLKIEPEQLKPRIIDLTAKIERLA